LVTINELLIPVWTLVTASLYCIPFNLSLNTPVIEDVVYSTESIANWIAWTAYTLIVSSNPLNIVVNGACPVFTWPSWEVSINANPCFL